MQLRTALIIIVSLLCVGVVQAKEIIITNKEGYYYGTNNTAFEALFKQNSNWGDNFKYCLPSAGGRQCFIYQPTDMSYKDLTGSQDYLENIRGNDAVVTNSIITYPDVFNNTALTYEITSRGVKEEFVINQLPRPPAAYLTSNITLDIGGYIKYNTGVRVFDGDVDVTGQDFTTKNNIYFKYGNVTAYRLPSPYAVSNDGQVMPLEYEVNYQQSQIYFYVKTPYEWLARVEFPVRIDPTIEGETYVVNFTGSQVNWAVPANVYNVTVELWGGGGAAGSTATTSNTGGGGGAGGQFARSVINVTPGQLFNITVANNRTHGGVANTNGLQGFNTSFANNTVLVQAVGGGGGQSVSNGQAGGSGSLAGSIGQVLYHGGNGGAGASASGAGGGGAGSTAHGGNASTTTAGVGASEWGGDGFPGATANGAGGSGYQYGGGGEGGRRNALGGTGHQGIVRLTYTEYLEDTTGYLEVSITSPANNTAYDVGELFYINASITCREGDCGVVSASPRFNASSGAADTVLNSTTSIKLVGSTVPGGTPNTTYDLRGVDVGDWITTTYWIYSLDSYVYSDGEEIVYLGVYNGSAGGLGIYNKTANLTYNLMDTDPGNWIGTSDLIGLSIVYSSEAELVYFGGTGGKFGVYNRTANVSYDLTATDVGNWWGTSHVYELAVDQSSGGELVYLAGQGGKFGVYNRTANLTYDLSATDVGGWIGTAFAFSVCVDESSGGELVYVTAAVGGFGVYNRTANKTYDLRLTDPGGWLQQYVWTCYVDPDSDGQLVYVGGEGGRFGVYNKTANLTYDLSATDPGNWMGTGYLYRTGSDRNSKGEMIYLAHQNGYGVYNRTANVTYNITGTAVDNWLAGSSMYIRDVTFVNNSYNYYNYIGGNQGRFGQHFIDSQPASATIYSTELTTNQVFNASWQVQYNGAEGSSYYVDALFASITYPDDITSNHTTDRYVYNGTGGSEDTCTYSGTGNWNINCADNCQISTPINMGGNNILANGNGLLTITSAITNYNIIRLTNSCKMRLTNGGSIT